MSSSTSSSRSQGGDESDKADLFVFGYACKLFRDDEKAEIIEKGSHLIPWMGDEKLKMDRYDGRGALFDLTQYEACSENMDWSDTAEDCEEDQLCEYERYRSLYLDEEAEQTYREEQAKRTQAEHAEISYEYDNPANNDNTVSTQDGNQESETTGSKPFVPPAELALPPNMQLPTTVKHNAIIVRTALFLAQQGSQMEILMKVKQQSNRNFDFLSHTDPLHEYYKHVLGLIKSGVYVPQEQHLEETTTNTATAADQQLQLQHHQQQQQQQQQQQVGVALKEDQDEHYLHPSLVTKLTATSNPSPPPAQIELRPRPAPPVETSPPDFVQKIIEKMVKYVIKNGPLFEAAILKRGDVRFSFLNPKNPYNAFYKEQLMAKQKLIDEANCLDTANNQTKLTMVNNNNNNNNNSNNNNNNSKEIADDQQQHSGGSDGRESPTGSSKGLKRKPLPVCFSIKKAKENEGLEVASALPVEESSDEEETQNSNSPKPSQPPPPLPPTQQQQQQPQPQTTTTAGGSGKIEPADTESVNTLDKRLKKSAEITKKHKQKKDANLQNERKLKVAQFLKDLKKKTT